MYGTTIQQGSFVAVAAPTTLKIRSGVDWIKVYDPVNADAAAAVGFEYSWQFGMPQGRGMMLYHAAASTVVNSSYLAAPLGFTIIDTSTAVPSAAIAVGAGTNATQPVYDTANTQVMQTGAIVRLSSTAQNNLNGLDFSVLMNPGDTNVRFTLANTLATAPGVVAGAAGFYRLIAYNLEEYDRFVFGRRVISAITQDVPGTNRVRTLVDHGLTTGQKVRINVPANCGMIELNNQLVTATVIDAANFTIDVDTTGYTAFTFPVAGLVVQSVNYAEMVPVGIAMAYNTSTASATNAKDFIGVKLGYDATAAGLAPAGIAGHTMFWMAGKSVNV